MLQIAKILKSNGTDGGLLIGVRDIEVGQIDLQEPVFIEFDGLPVPFFISAIKPRGTSKALVRLEDVDSFASAEELVGKAVLAEADSLEDYEEEEDLTGWTLLHADGRKAGIVTDYEDIPGNPCIYVDTENGQEVLVPLHEDLILSVDPERRELTMDLPDGLIP